MDLMIDLETLAADPLNSAICQIGWAAFDPNGHGVADSGVISVNAQTCLDMGMVADWTTLQWWLRQDEAARMQLQTEGEEVGIQEALIDLGTIYSRFSGDQRRDDGEPDARVWAYPADFDLAILRHAHHLAAKTYGIVGERPYWHRRRTRCAKTLVMASGIRRETVEEDIAHLGLVKHRADHDSVRQAYYVQAAVQALGGAIES